ncbi:unnamed protein product [Tuber aestivum]|uniref:Uncharacterized protein n=1 Tax=Tuber aestivum TaxID=59557 RepID=A0A292PVE3_9PEZI|nr:unnamed protein product [Tuber aestivum]
MAWYHPQHGSSSKPRKNEERLQIRLLVHRYRRVAHAPVVRISIYRQQCDMVWAGTVASSLPIIMPRFVDPEEPPLFFPHPPRSFEANPDPETRQPNQVQ